MEFFTGFNMMLVTEFIGPNLFGYVVLFLFLTINSQTRFVIKLFDIRANRKAYHDAYKLNLEKIAEKAQLTITENEETIIDKLIANYARFSLYTVLGSIWPLVYFFAIPNKLGSITVLFIIEIASFFLLLTQYYENMKRKKRIIFEGLKS